jgi:hypothetical protein
MNSPIFAKTDGSFVAFGGDYPHQLHGPEKGGGKKFFGLFAGDRRPEPSSPPSTGVSPTRRTRWRSWLPSGHERGQSEESFKRLGVAGGPYFAVVWSHHIGTMGGLKTDTAAGCSRRTAGNPCPVCTPRERWPTEASISRSIPPRVLHLPEHHLRPGGGQERRRFSKEAR